MTKAFLIFLLIIISGFVTDVFAQETDHQIVQKYGIVFPIAELGNCNNIVTCKIYCDQPENKDACIAFAKSKGFYKETIDEQRVNTLSFAKTELGCDNVISCKTLCQQRANQQRCQAFAQKHGLSSPQTSSKDEELLAQAKQNLGCDSFEECKTLCDQKANYTKCAALLQDQVTSDDRAMFEKYKTQIKEYLGCDSIVTCMAFCMNPLNTAKCAELGNKIGGNETPSMEPPEVWCPNISSECKWDGTNCVCNGPQTCSQSNDIPGCTWDGTQCNCPPTNTEESPEVWCPRAGPGCTWDGKQCICPGSGTPTQTDISQQTTEPGEVWCPRLGPYCVWDGSSCTCWDDCVKAGGTWTGSRCEFPTPTAEPGEVWCPRNPGCTWTGDTCLCEAIEVPKTEQTTQPAVQGTSTNRGLLFQILDFIF